MCSKAIVDLKIGNREREGGVGGVGRWGDGEMGRWGDLIEFSVRVAWPTANRVAALLEHRTDFTEL
ncbi:MAG: hypothetical protein F6J98_25620 [Moorea sp. SIO4G2]|nr:hypothetical protein [Moorena sp. SIO4G2]